VRGFRSGLAMTCPSAEDLAAYLDGVLRGPERRAIERHLVTCDDCRELFAESVRALQDLEAEDRAVVVPFRPARPLFRYGLPAGLAAAAALLIVASFTLISRERVLSTPRQRLVIDVGDARPIEARLTGGYEWGPYRGAPRAATPESRPVWLISAEGIARELERTSSAESLSTGGAAELLAGRADAAIARLEAARKLSSDPAILNDLATAHLVRARSVADGGADLKAAIELLDEVSKRRPALREAAFNRALALEYSGDRARAREAWLAYARLDPSSPWTEEARRRADVLQAP
jgi:tetratricopeptide (TPR) repeat protein